MNSDKAGVSSRIFFVLTHWHTRLEACFAQSGHIWQLIGEGEVLLGSLSDQIDEWGKAQVVSWSLEICRERQKSAEKLQKKAIFNHCPSGFLVTWDLSRRAKVSRKVAKKQLFLTAGHIGSPSMETSFKQISLTKDRSWVRYSTKKNYKWYKNWNSFWEL